MLLFKGKFLRFRKEKFTLSVFLARTVFFREKDFMDRNGTKENFL